MMNFKHTFLHLLVAGAALCFAVTPALAVGDTIIAVVNDDVITLKDLREYIGGIYNQLRLEGKTDYEIEEVMASYEQKGINQLIEDRLILDAAETMGIEVRPEIIDRRVDDIKERYPSEQKFIQALAASGISVTDLKKKITDQLKAKYIVDIEVKDKIFVNPQEVTRYYDEHKASFIQNARLHLDSVFVSFNKGREEARLRAAEARQKLLDGVDYKEVFKEYSDLPSVGTVEQGKLMPQIEEEIFKMKIGDISSLIEVEGGVYVFKLSGKSRRKTIGLKEAKEQIYDRIFQQKFRVKFSEWIAQLRKDAYIEIKE